MDVRIGLAQSVRELELELPDDTDVEALLDDALVALGVTTALPVGPPYPTPVVAVLEEAWRSVFDGPLEVEGSGSALVHPDGLRRALTCVLDNASKYGGEVRVEVHDDGDEVVVTVADRGPGIAAGEEGLLFEPFFRGERAVMIAPGLGLGLTVARRLVEHDGGRVEVQPGPDGGAVATVRVPRP